MEYRSLNDDQIENIATVAKKVAEEVDPTREPNSLKKELAKLIANPIWYLQKNGLKESIVKLIKKNGTLRQALSYSLVKLARIIRDGIEILRKNCIQCKVGLLILLPALLAANGFPAYSLNSIQDLLIHPITKYFYFDRAVCTPPVNTVLKALKEAGIPHLTAENIAEFICYHAGLCENRGIL